MLQCSVNAIKIDPALVARSHSSPGALNLLKGILALTEKLDIVVIAEGIESEAQFTQLQQLGCCHMQGLYFGEPLMSQDVPQLFKEQ
jgi:EAL domain-containing protein (putative c-di-GMP-specific phosphodiesterase class I)